jgi:hypothetical protein
MIEKLESQETEESRKLGLLNLIVKRRGYIYTIAIELNKIYNN